MAVTLYVGIRLDIPTNRKKFLSVLRSGKYIKGDATSDKKTGKPIVKIEGYCACAVMIHEFSTRFNYKEAREALGLTSNDCKYIQSQLNDTDLTFSQIADRIETEVFK